MERFQKGKRFRGSGFRVQGSGFRVQGCGGSFAAITYEAMPESSIQVTSHSRFLIPSHESLLSKFRVSPWGGASFDYV